MTQGSDDKHDEQAECKYHTFGGKGECPKCHKPAPVPPTAAQEEESPIHSFTMRQAIKDGLPPETALVHWSDVHSLWMRYVALRSASEQMKPPPGYVLVAEKSFQRLLKHADLKAVCLDEGLAAFGLPETAPLTERGESEA